MRVTCISDIHGLVSGLKKVLVPSSEILFVAGDLTDIGEIGELIAVASYLGSLPHKYKVVVAGNHDYCFDNQESTLAKSIMEDYGLIYLQDSSVEIEGYKIYGTPWSATKGWAFDYSSKRGSRRKIYFQNIPEDTDILLTHAAPKDIMDIGRGRSWGSPSLKKHVLTRVKPKVHIFGHIHESTGTCVKEGVLFVNSSLTTEECRLVKDGIEIDLDQKI